MMNFEMELISISQLSQQLGISRRSIDRFIERGELPSLKLGRRRLVRLADVSAWLDGHIATASAGPAHDAADEVANVA